MSDAATTTDNLPRSTRFLQVCALTPSAAGVGRAAVSGAGPHTLVLAGA